MSSTTTFRSVRSLRLASSTKALKLARAETSEEHRALITVAREAPLLRELRGRFEGRLRLRLVTPESVTFEVEGRGAPANLVFLDDERRRRGGKRPGAIVAESWLRG